MRNAKASLGMDGAKLWNQLGMDTREIKDPKKFKAVVKEYRGITPFRHG